MNADRSFCELRNTLRTFFLFVLLLSFTEYNCFYVAASCAAAYAETILLSSIVDSSGAMLLSSVIITFSEPEKGAIVCMSNSILSFCVFLLLIRSLSFCTSTMYEDSFPETLSRYAINTFIPDLEGDLEGLADLSLFEAFIKFCLLINNSRPRLVLTYIN